LNSDCIYIISHPTSTRLKSAQRTAEFLARKLGGSIQIISEQPEFRASRVPQVALLARRLARQRIVRRTAQMIHESAKSHSEVAIIPVGRAKGIVRTHERKQRFIERVLYRKHISAWEHAISNDYRGFIVLEDDALLRDDSERLLDGLQNMTHCDYLDLGGGFERDVLRQYLHITNLQDSYWESVPPVTNTTCAYYIDASFAGKILSILRRKQVQRLPIDWALNYAFIEVHGRVCHSYPSVLSHASMTGAFVSDIR